MAQKRSQKKKVEFKFDCTVNASKVFVAGDFTNWEERMIPLSKKRNAWVCKVDLEPGQHQYKFMADGTWYNDLNAISQIPNGCGSENSLLIIS